MEPQHTREPLEVPHQLNVTQRRGMFWRDTQLCISRSKKLQDPLDFPHRLIQLCPFRIKSCIHPQKNHMNNLNNNGNNRGTNRCKNVSISFKSNVPLNGFQKQIPERSLGFLDTFLPISPKIFQGGRATSDLEHLGKIISDIQGHRILNEQMVRSFHICMKHHVSGRMQDITSS